MADARHIGLDTDKKQQAEDSPAEEAVKGWEEVERLSIAVSQATSELEQIEGEIERISSLEGPVYSDAGYEMAGLNDQAAEAKDLMKELGQDRGGGIIQLMRDAVQFERVREVYVENCHAREALASQNPNLSAEMEKAEKEYQETKDSLKHLKNEAKTARERANGLKAAHQASQKHAEGRLQAANEAERQQAAIRLAGRGNESFREAHPTLAAKAEAEIGRRAEQGQEQQQGQGQQQEQEHVRGR